MRGLLLDDGCKDDSSRLAIGVFSLVANVRQGFRSPTENKLVLDDA